MSNLMAILFGLAVFAVIVAIGWRSVQNRKILRMQGANGQETIIVAREDDDITSIATETEIVEPVTSAPTAQVDTFGRGDKHKATAVAASDEAAVEVIGQERLARVVDSSRTVDNR